MSNEHLLCFGMGYSARAFARRCLDRGWRVTGTSRSAEGVSRIQETNAHGILFDGREASDDLAERLSLATHVLVSAGPDSDGDPVLRCCTDILCEAFSIQWVGYLSTVGVYGDHGGECSFGGRRWRVAVLSVSGVTSTVVSTH